MSTQNKGGSGNPPALDDILGRARNALNRSQQFRANVQALGASSFGGFNKVSQSSVQNVRNNNKPSASVKSLMAKVPPLQKGTRPPNKVAAVARTSKAQVSQTSSSSSEEDLRLVLQNAPDVSSADSEDGSDSTITPPTITDTSAKDNRRTNKSHKHRRHSPKNDAPRNSPRSAMKTKDLVEKTIIVRGDQMSTETYNAIKSMQVSSKDGEQIDYEGKSHRRNSLLEEIYLPQEESYTEDFISEIRSLNERSEEMGSYAEVPKTESSVEKPSTAAEDDFTKHMNSSFIDEETKASHLRSFESLSLVEEIRSNLQSLQVADFPSKATQILIDGDETDNPLDEFPEDDGSSSVNILQPSSDKRQIKDLRQIRSSRAHQNGDSGSLHERSSVAGSSGGSVRSKSFYSKRVSYKEIPQKGIDSKVSLDKSDAGLSIASFTSGSRLSETQSFQLALAKIHVDEDEEDSNANFSPSQLPAKTKPQIKIHQILKQEVYAKELKRLRELRKKEEKIMKKLSLVKAENYMKSKASEAGIKNYLQPNYTNLLKKPSKESNSSSSTSGSKPPTSHQSSALVLHSDAVRSSSSISRGYGKTNKSELYRERVSKMNLQHLVQEVVASNERMYDMTIAAAHNMAKQHGKDAKLLMKIKRKREEKFRK